MKDRLRSLGIPMKIMVLLSLTVASCLVGSQERAKVAPKIEEEKKVEPNAASGTWEPIFFSAIDERAKIAKLTNLRTAFLSNEDLELRVWIGFGLIPLEGFVISHRGEQWSAIHLRSIGPHLPKSRYQNVLPTPRSGWDHFWRRLTDEGILSLPDSSELKDEVMTRDGESFVVEIKWHDSYRAYHYQNPQSQKWPEAASMIRIAKVILEEFQINRQLLARD
ncbi:MAG TPA: hypothetical protein VK208_08370 [Pyrinomonadaceae bacterium]|jgi:hypothetical protein|nr:hypothetical protein [Pyrinomonadaceae bacterium]